MPITKVAVAGATGNLGPAVLKELKTAGFELTVLTRSSDKQFVVPVQTQVVDYSSVESLTRALQGQDALVITLGAVGLEPHLNVVNAAVAAGVKRIIPSEFGCDTTNPKAAALPVYRDKVAIQERLKEIATSSETSYTLILNGAFLDWGLKVGFLLNFASDEPELYDGGNQLISSTTLSGIGKAVVGVLKNLEATRNKAVHVSSAAISQMELLRMAGKQGSHNIVQTKDLEQAAFAELQKPNPNIPLFAVNLVRRAMFGEGYGGYFPPERLWNDTLGVPALSKEEVREIVSKYSSTSPSNL